MSLLLLVMPSPKLDPFDELIAAMGVNQVEVLRAPLSVDTFLNRVQTGDWWGVHFAGDSYENGIEVSDGQIVDLPTFQQAIAGNTRTPQFVFVNSCASMALAAAAYEVGVPYTIGWTGKVPDSVASLFGTSFYVNLRLSRDIKKSFDAAVDVLRIRFPGSSLPVMLDGRVSDLERRVGSMTGRVREIEAHHNEYIQLRRVTFWLWLVLPITLSLVLLALEIILRR